MGAGSGGGHPHTHGHGHSHATATTTQKDEKETYTSASAEDRGVAHVNGFGEDEVRAWFEGAGLTGFVYDDTSVKVGVGKIVFEAFIAKGVKA
jgi:hypothetical protein